METYINFSEIPAVIARDKALIAALENLETAHKLYLEAEDFDRFTNEQFEARGMNFKLSKWAAVAAYATAMQAATVAEINARITA